MAPVAIDHARHDQTTEMQHGADVDVDQQVDVIRLGLEQFPGLVDAGIVDQNVNMTETLGGGFQGEPSSCVLAQVGHQMRGANTPGARHGAGILETHTRIGDQQQVHPGIRKRRRQWKPQASIGTGKDAS